MVKGEESRRHSQESEPVPSEEVRLPDPPDDIGGLTLPHVLASSSSPQVEPEHGNSTSTKAHLTKSELAWAVGAGTWVGLTMWAALSGHPILAVGWTAPSGILAGLGAVRVSTRERLQDG